MWNLRPLTPGEPHNGECCCHECVKTPCTSNYREMTLRDPSVQHALDAMLEKVRAVAPTSEEAEVRRSVASAMAGGTADGPTQRGWDPTEFEG